MSDELIIDESSLAHIERKSLTVLKRKQDDIFVGDSEYVDLEELVNDSGMLNNTRDISVKVSLGRNIFNLRKNYLKIRIRSRNSEQYMNNTETIDERVNSVLQSLDFSTNIEISINYPENYPFVCPRWAVERYHGYNINTELVKGKIEDLILQKNRKNATDWSPVNNPRDDIKSFLNDMNGIWCLMGRTM